MPYYCLNVHSWHWSYNKWDSWVFCWWAGAVAGHFIVICCQVIWINYSYWSTPGICVSVHIYIDGLVQERCNSSALVMELYLSCTNPLICHCSIKQSFVEYNWIIVAAQWNFWLRFSSLQVSISKYCISRVSCQKGPTRHAYAWQIGPFWQDTIDMCNTYGLYDISILCHILCSFWRLIFSKIMGIFNI